MLKKEPHRKGFGGACRLLVLAAILAAASSSHAAVEVIALRHRSPSEVLPFVKPLLSAEGKISADDRTSHLIIVDSEEAIERVRQTLEILDRQAPQATIRVRFQETAGREDRSVAGGGRVSGDQWSVSGGRMRRSGEGVDVRVQDRSVSLPISTNWVDLCRRYGRTVAYRRIETGFDVRPVIRETLADVEIVPRISAMGSDGRGEAVRFTEAATRTVVPLGQWIAIGGADQSASEVVRAILQAGASRQSSGVSIQLMIEAP